MNPQPRHIFRSGGPMVAMVALNQPSLPAMDLVSRSLAQSWPQGPELAAASVQGDVATFEFRGELACAGLVRAPIPWGDLEGPCEAAWYWPVARETMARHKAHIIVSLVRSSLAPLNAALLLTKLVAAVASHIDCAGVYWCPGPLVHEPEFFVETSASASMDDLPLLLWVGFRVGRAKDGSCALATVGLAAFGLMEIETEDPHAQPSYLVDKVANLANYLLQWGPVVKDHDTFGTTESERILVRHERSRYDRSSKVYRLYFSG